MAYLALALMWIAVAVPVSIGIYLTHSPWFLLGFLFVSCFSVRVRDTK